MTVFMKKTKPMISPKRQVGHMAADFAEDFLVTAEQASAALNLPLYYFIDARKRTELGIPYYSINRMVRYRIRELHKWNVIELVILDGYLKTITETTHIVGTHFFGLVRNVHRLARAAHAIAFNRVRQNNGGLVLMIYCGVEGGIHLMGVVTTAIEIPNVFIAPVRD